MFNIYYTYYGNYFYYCDYVYYCYYGYYIHLYLVLRLFSRYFLFHTLDKALCPLLVKYFDMPIWHPTDEKSLDLLMDAQVDM